MVDPAAGVDPAGVGPFPTGLGLAAPGSAGGVACDGAGDVVVRNASDQCVHGSVFRLRHPRCGGGSGVRQFAGANPSGPDLECTAGALAAHFFQAHGSAGSSAADRSDPPGVDAVCGIDDPPGGTVHCVGWPHRRPGVRAWCLRCISRTAGDGPVDGLWPGHAGLPRPGCAGARLLCPWRWNNAFSALAGGDRSERGF